MKVRVLTPHSLGGGRDVFPGETVDLPEKEARLKIERGWAEHIVTRDPKAASRDPKPAAEPTE